MAVGRPVQVMWTREDDLAHGEYREATAHRIRAELTDSGLPRTWLHRIACAASMDHQAGAVSPLAGMGAADLSYRLGQVRVEWSGVPQPLPLRIWRSVSHSYNAFAVESFLDEVAITTGADPRSLRRELLVGGPRLQRCLETVAHSAGWSSARADGRFLGIAATQCMGSYVAQIAEVEADGGDRPVVKRLWCAADCGVVVNPDIARAQIEGGMLYALDAVLGGGIELDAGQVIGRNFDRHRVLRMADAPAIAVELISSRFEPSGVGEIGVPCVAPAMANAWYRATGRRVRSLWGSAAWQRVEA
jgi:isoquinoline 1-oxidoreductase beta subunit